MSESGLVYLWFDRKHKRFYIGSHWGSVDDGYVSSSRWMRKAYRRRPADFKRRILVTITTTRHDLLVEEARWLRMIKPSEIKVRYYNVKTKGDHLWFANPDDLLTVGQKISKALKGKKYGPRPERSMAISLGKLAAYAEKRAAGIPVINETTRRALDRSGTVQTEKDKKARGVGVRHARARNKKWDKTHDLVCVYCEKAFRGREDQRHCSAKCRANHWYHNSSGSPGTKRRTLVKTCAHCGKEHQRRYAPKFCSRQCNIDYYNARKAAPNLPALSA